MAKTKISEFSSTPGNNTDIDGINIAEGCAPSGINNAIRELMSQLKDWQAGTSNDPMVIGSTGSLTLSYGTANGVAYLNGSKVLTTGSALTFDGTNLGVGASPTFYGGQVATAGSIAITGGNLLKLWNTGGTGVGGISSPGTDTLAFGLGSGFAEQMRLTSTGLGIGTSSPVAKLHVRGATNGNLLVRGGASAASGLTGTALSSINDAASATVSLNFEGSEFNFVQNNAVTATLNSSGNLGLGVTPSASTRGKGFDIGLTGGLYGDGITVNFSTHLTNNAYPLANGNWVYKNSSQVAQRYSMESSGQHQWFTAPSGTAGNAISFTQAMTLDASGNLGVGTTSPALRLHVATGGSLGARVENTLNSSAAYVQVKNTAGSTYLGQDATGGYLITDYAAPILFYTNNTERARIDSSGNLMVGTQSAVGRATIDAGANSNGLFVINDTYDFQTLSLWNKAGASDNLFARFFTESSITLRGSITYNRGAGLTAYNTTSDYRAKNINGPVLNALATVAQLKPYMGTMKGATVERPMFVAHETQAVAQYAVTGEKDAVDKDGNPVFQQMDHSTLVPLLTAAIQEQQAIINQLKARLDAANL